MSATDSLPCRRRLPFAVIRFLVLAGLLILTATPASAAVFTVRQATDTDDGVCDTHCTLREAIRAANQGPGPDVIVFNIGGGGAATISPLTTLPPITDRVSISGYTQPGSVRNTLAVGSNAVVLVTLSGLELPTGGDGLVLAGGAGGSSINGLRFRGFSAVTSNTGGVGLLIGNAANNGDHVIEGNLFENNARRHIEIGRQATNVLIGGPALGDRNVFIGSLRDGVVTQASGTIIRNNDFGFRFAGVTPLFSTFGQAAVRVADGGIDVRDVEIFDNMIVGGTEAGVRINDSLRLQAIDIRNNRMLRNPGPAIDIGVPGLNPDDAGDADEGPNDLQNAPTLDFAALAAATGDVTIRGHLSSSPGQTFRLDFYANPVDEPDEFDEASIPVGSLSGVATDANGLATFSLTIASSPIRLDDRLTATATAEATRGTSELSAPQQVRRSLVVTHVGDSGAGSLRQALLDANQGTDEAAISFAIAGTGPHEITPLTPLPAITTPLLIDGYTQPGAAPNALAEGSNAQLQVELVGRLAGVNANGLRVNARSVIRGLVINRFNGAGIQLGLAANGAFNGSTVVGNFIGTSVNGLQARGNGIGIEALGQQETRFLTIGGAALAERNVISANTTAGIRTSQILAGANAPQLFEVVNNLIGVAANLSPRGNGVGVEIGGNSAQVRVGAGVPGLGNVIAHNVGAGVALPTGAGVANFTAIRGNAMFANGGLAIDLGNPGVTPNDPDDGDIGPNGLQNAPVLGSVEIIGNAIRVSGVLDRPSQPAGATLGFTLDLHANASCDASGSGEGQVWLGAAVAAVGADDAFVVTLPAVLPSGMNLVSMTATSFLPNFTPDGATSEFSNCVVAAAGETLVFADGFE
jgi:CSLREA domain-containing protein